MKLYRIINNTLIEEFPDWLENEGTVYTNSLAEEIAISNGNWHPLIVNPVPEFNPDTQYILKRYTLENNNIVLNWDVYTNTSQLDANIE